MLYDFGLRRADLIAAQTEYQARLLRENHGLESTVVNMMVEPPSREEPPPPTRTSTSSGSAICARSNVRSSRSSSRASCRT